MKHTLLLTAIAATLASCALSATEEKRLTTLDTFDHVVIQSAFDVELHLANEYRVEVETSAKLLEKAIIRVRNGVLTLDISDDLPQKTVRDIDVKIFAPYYELISLHTAVDLSCKNTIKQPKMEILTKGAAKIELELMVDSLLVNSKGASNIELKGAAKYAAITLNGTVNYDADDLQTEDMLFIGKGTISGELAVNRTFNVDVRGICNIVYTGNPTINYITEPQVTTIIKQKK